MSELQEFRKKPVTVQAAQWFKNGDHPEDGTTGEGKIVRYYRNPYVRGTDHCTKCGEEFHIHGWIDTLEGGHIVCPGDWVITGVQGEHYPCKPDIFAATYEPVEVSDQPLNPPNEGEWLDQAVEAAAETQFLSRYPDSSAWSGATPWEKSEWHRKARITILAALPHIREHIAQEIEVHMRRHDNAQIGFSAVGDAYAHAASIARGKDQA